MNTAGEVRLGTAAGRWVLGAAVVGSSVAILDSTVVNTALPAIGRSLGTGFAGLQWVVEGYLLALGSLVIAGGAIGDRYGRRAAYLAGLVAFGAASVGVAVAPSLGVLVAARLSQGVAAALLVPVSLALVSATFHPDDRGAAIGRWSAWGALASAAGPVVGGALVQYGSWRLAFGLNVPLVVVGLVVAWLHVPESRDPEVHPPDVLGAVTLAVGLGGVVYALVEGPARGWHPSTIAAGAVGLAALVGFAVAEARVRAPMLPLSLFRSVAFTGANAITVLLYGALGSALMLVTLDLQNGLGYGPLQAGASFLPLTAGMIVLSPWAGRLAGTWGPRAPMTAGPLLAGIGLALFGRIAPGSTYVGSVLPAVAVFAAGLGLTVAPLTTVAMTTLDQRHAGVASGVNNAAARCGSLLAIAAVPFVAGVGADLAGSMPRAMAVCAGLAFASAGVAAVTLRGWKAAA